MRLKFAHEKDNKQTIKTFTKWRKQNDMKLFLKCMYAESIIMIIVN